MSSVLERLNDWLKINGSGVALIAAGLVLVTAVGCGGLQFDKWITADVPLEIQKGIGVPSRVPLRDSTRVFKAWMNAGEQFAKNIEDSQQFLGVVEGMFSLALQAGGTAIPGWGGMAAMFFGGLMLKGPGSGKEKNKSYNKGRTDAESLLIPLLREAGITIPPTGDSA